MTRRCIRVPGTGPAFAPGCSRFPDSALICRLKQSAAWSGGAQPHQIGYTAAFFGRIWAILNYPHASRGLLGIPIIVMQLTFCD